MAHFDYLILGRCCPKQEDFSRLPKQTKGLRTAERGFGNEVSVFIVGRLS
jgi:hypothetical protein